MSASANQGSLWADSAQSEASIVFLCSILTEGGRVKLIISVIDWQHPRIPVTPPGHWIIMTHGVSVPRWCVTMSLRYISPGNETGLITPGNCKQRLNPWSDWSISDLMRGSRAIVWSGLKMHEWWLFVAIFWITHGQVMDGQINYSRHAHFI